MILIGLFHKTIIFFQLIEKELIQNELGKMGWFLLVLALCSAILVFLKVVYPKAISNVFDSVFNYNYSIKNFKEQNISSLYSSILMNVLFTISFTCFVFELFVYKNKIFQGVSPFVFFLILLLGILLFYLIKILLIYLSAFLFNDKTIGNEYVYNLWACNKCLGITILPVAIVLPFLHMDMLNVLLYIGFFFIGCSLLLRYLRGYKILTLNGISGFYKILYFCTLEILPVLFVGKLVLFVIRL